MTQLDQVANRQVCDPVSARAAVFEQNARFSEAIGAYIRRFIEFRQHNSLFNKIISYHVRWRVAGFLLYLSADRERYGANGGASYSRLLEMCNRHPKISKRSLATLITLLQVSGMVTTSRSLQDGRSKVYQPTARMQKFTTPWLTYATKTLDLLEPEHQRYDAFLNEPEFQDRFMVAVGRWHETAKPLVERLPRYTAFFGGRDGAGAVMLAVVLARLDDQPMMSRAALGTMFGLSKSQVTKVLREGEALGYFALDDLARPMATDLLMQDLRTWVATELAFYAVNMPRTSIDGYKLEAGLPAGL